MPDFAYTVIDTSGREKQGKVRAESATDARAQLEAKRLYVVKMGEAAQRSAAKGPVMPWSAGGKRLSNKELTLFTRQLSTLAQVSPLEEALRTINRQSEKDHMRAIVGRVHAGVLEGRSLADALSAEPRSFPPLFRAMISAGERSGSLPQLTERLSVLLERQAEMRSKVLTAIAYPSVLAAFAMIVTMSLMIFVVPLVVEQFDTLGQQLPLLTRIVMGLSLFLAGAETRAGALKVRWGDPARAVSGPTDPRSPRRAHGPHALDHGAEPSARGGGFEPDRADRPQPRPAHSDARNRGGRARWWQSFDGNA
jgi:general secretion pathway protein F